VLVLHSETSQKISIITFYFVRGIEKAVYQEKQMGQVRRKSSSHKAACEHQLSLLEGW